MLPILTEATRGKSLGACWLDAQGWYTYLAGDTPESSKLLRASELWRLDPRVGVGLDADRRSASEGRLFSMQAVAMIKRGQRIGTSGQTSDYDVGFLAGVSGALPPASGALRLGGDGRGAALMSADLSLPEVDLEQIRQTRRCRLILTTPGCFEQGWLPTGMHCSEAGAIHFELGSVRARLVSAAVQRAEIISGWDLAERAPKAAERVAPTGSVYWLDQIEASAEDLRKLSVRGLWQETHYAGNPRRAEGFNRFVWGLWP